MHRSLRHTALLAAGLFALAASHAGAQTMGYDGGGDDGAASKHDGDKDRGRGRGARKVKIAPYIEASQVATVELSPGSSSFTYTSLAAGVDASIQGRRTQAAASLRYERRIAWGSSNVDSDSISGLARASTQIIPRTLMLEGGALASRTRVVGNGQTVLGSPAGNPSTHLWSLYAGPTLSTAVDDVKVDGGYRIGYTKVGSSGFTASSPDVFDHSLAQNGELHLATRPHTVLPVGLGVGGGFYQEDVSNFDQRVRDLHARADVTVPLGPDLAVVGGVGYEHVTISSRDVARTTAGAPIIGSDGRYVTDHSGPRQIAYDTKGLIWDAGVLWRPSRRTALEAHVGRRYGTISYYGSFAYAPSSRSSFNVSVYDNVSGFGGQVNRALVALPTDFTANRNPLTGDIGSCVASLAGGSCLGGALGSIRSATFRARGVMASYGVDLGRLSAGVGGGYDRRKFFAAPGTILASANGTIDENWWLAAYLNGKIDERSDFTTNVYANWFKSGVVGGYDGTALGANAAYHRSLARGLSGTVAVGLDGITRDAVDDYWSASALLGLRYSFF